MKKLFLIRRNLDKKVYLTISLISFLILFGAWIMLSVGGLVNSTFLPTPMSVLGTFFTAVKEGTLFGDMYISIFRIFMGFIIAVIIGVPLGILTGTFKSCEAFIQPIAEFIRYSFKEYFFFANAEFIKYIAYEQASEFVNIDTTNKIISNNFSMINSPFN